MILAIYNPKGWLRQDHDGGQPRRTDLARRAARCLLVDLEADMGASISVGVGPGDKHPSIYELPAQPAPSLRTPSLRQPRREPAAGARLSRRWRASPPPCVTYVSLNAVLADCVRPLGRLVDDVIIDCPSNYTVLSLGATALAQHLLVPIRADYLSLESLAIFCGGIAIAAQGRRAWRALPAFC
jgi:cellulose biosynthesis protein BcsQ